MDFKALGENLGLEEGEFIEIVEIFLDTAFLDIGKLNEAHRDQNCEVASDAAHSLKGSSGNLGFSEIASLSAAIEDKARNKDISGLDTIIPILTSLLNQIKEQL